MKKSSVILALGLCPVLAGVTGGCGSGKGGGGAAKFTTSVPGDRPLGGLSPDELATLCSDGAKFAANPTTQMDNCRLAGFFAATFTAAFTTGATDATLQMSCTDAYNQCLNPPVPDGGAGGDGGAASSCSPAPANCTATVAEYVTCVNDEAAQTYAVASAVPSCNSLSTSTFAPNDGGAVTTNPTTPASCQLVQAKCSGLSDAAQSFVIQYCALVEPCCAPAGLSAQCSSVVTSAAQQGTYDPTAGAACLAALTARQASASFCSGLAGVITSSAPWALIPDCAAVFQRTGSTPVGGTCTQDSDCAAGPNGGGICVANFVTDDAGASTFVQTCAVLTGTVGDPCFGTRAYGGTATGPVQTGSICDQDRGVICDLATSLCTAVHATGAPCGAYDECDPARDYCNFGSGTCAARLALGATCVGSLSGECAGSGYCNSTTKRCTAAGGADATCSGTFLVQPECLSGFCSNGNCTSPLSPICQ